MTAPEPRSRVRIGIGAAVVLVLVALACAVLFSAVAPRGSTVSVTATSTAAAPTAAASGGIFVHILGAVKNPGLYELRDGDRAVDAVAAAGGFTDDAEQSSLNLARFVSDGEQIVVPVIGAEPTAAPGGGAGSAAGTSTGTGGVGGVGGKVNLNTADEAALETLPRIGPAMAARILAWRDENGRFTSVEDLQSIDGIGEKTFDALKDLVTV